MNKHVNIVPKITKSILVDIDPHPPHCEQTTMFQSLWTLLTILLIFRAMKDGSNNGGFAMDGAELRVTKSWALFEQNEFNSDAPLLFRR